MEISQAGIDLIKEFEGCKLEAYPDPGSGAAPWTIGVGHTKGVLRGDVITQQQADEFLRQDLRWVERAVNRYVEEKIAQHQYDALCSFVFNVGEFAFMNSTLLRKLNAGDKAGALAEFGKWTKASGKELAGLVRRRAAEAATFAGNL